MKKMFKKSIACLIAVLMVVSTMPFTVLAASGTLTRNGWGIIVAGTEGRWSDNQFNIVNDQEANNTSAGIIKFDVSPLMGKKVDSASLSYTIDSVGEDSVQGLTFYYTTNTTANTYITGGQTNNAGFDTGAGTTANESVASKLGFNTSDTLVTGTKTSSSDTDIAAAMQKVADAGKSVMYVVIMQTTAGGKSGSPWSDTKIKPTSVSISYSVSDKAYTRTDVATAKSKITQTGLDKAPYSGTANRAADGSYTASGLGGNDKMSNVLWSYGVSGDSAYQNAGDNSYYDFGLQYGDVTMLYTGSGDMAVPANCYFIRKGASSTFYPQTMFIHASNAVEVRKIWHAGEGSDGGAGYKVDSIYGTNYLDTTDYANPKSKAMNSNDKPFYYSNTLYVKPTSLSFDSNIATIGSVQVTAKIHDESPGWFQSADKSRGATLTDMGKIRVIDYSKLAAAIPAIKEMYAKVSADESAYCPTGLYNFYTAVDKIINLNPNGYFNTTSTSGNNYAECASAIADAEKYIATATTEPEKSALTYTSDNNKMTHAATCSKCGETSTEACAWNEGEETTPATCNQAGVTTYTCTKCGQTKTSSINPTGNHTWGKWIDGGATSGHTRQCTTCLTWDTYTAHNSNTKVDGYAATCTTAGQTDGYKCSDCGREMTAQETIDPLTHDWGEWTYAGNKQHTRTCANDSTHTETVACTEVGGACEVCGEVFVDFTAYDAALAAVKTNDDSEYTPASFTAYTNAVNAAKIDKATATQAQVDAAVTAIEEAEDLLVSNNVTITFVVYDEDGEEVKNDIVNAVYGQKVSLDAEGTVTKWTITDENGIDTLLERADSTIEILATKAQTVNAFLKEEEQKDPQKEYAKINYYGKNGVLIDVRYIEKTTYTTAGLTAGVAAPVVAFYTFDSWTLNSIRYGATDEVDIYANYKANEDTARCTIHFGGQTRSYAYDSYVYLSSWAAWNADANLALSKTPNQSGILTYIDGKAFYAPHASDIYVIEVAAKQDSTAITGSYSLADKSMGTGAVFNAKFYATDMSKVQEFGIVVINPVTGVEKVVKADMASENNEYSVRVDLPATTSLTSLKAKSYVVIDGVTLYSSVATQAL